MDDNHRIDTIDLATFQSLLQEYPTVVAPKLADLDNARYETIPTALAERTTAYRPATAGAVNPPSLTKPELLTLVDWKLSHGTFRPSLKKLAESNDDSDVALSTGIGFALYFPTDKAAANSLKALTGLKGVGPATASLLMSVYHPDTAPFFSDELYRWCLWDTKPATGWSRVIKYAPKDYLAMYTVVDTNRRRLDVKAVDLEKVAYVLGKRATGKAPDNGDKPPAEPKRKAEDDVKEDAPATKKPSTERKPQRSLRPRLPPRDPERGPPRV